LEPKDRSPASLRAAIVKYFAMQSQQARDNAALLAATVLLRALWG
jgi:hypothetical protein